MALEQKLHLKLSQKLIMTPSLQQAIKLLQLSKLELQEVLNQELLENPLLEENGEEAKAEEVEAESPQQKGETEEPPKVELKEGEHFTRTRKRIRQALIANGVALEIEALVAQLIGVTPVPIVLSDDDEPEDDDAD